MAAKKMTIYRLQRPKNADINKQVMWFSGAMGLFTCRDRSKSCYRIFLELLKAAKQGKALSSDEIAYRLHLSRGAVVHHLNNLIDSGMVLAQKNKYALREASLDLLVKDLKKEMDEMFAEINSVAEEIDRMLD
ncbi:MAG: ArsR family transcriptional regulator [Candidatus Nanoarchaeia archaeon]|nr:ArsR family transcriptional regulator [Candidatus Nanoarchaeia archaeon]